MKKVVFLDYDGVVNRKMWKMVDGEWVCRYAYPEDGAVNDAQAVAWVSEFCEKYEYDIVVSSTWRRYPEWEDCLRNAGLRESVHILGATSLPIRNRADEISEYLAAHPEIENYLIFDDEPVTGRGADKQDVSDLDFEKHTVLCRKEYGFGENEYTLAIATHWSLVCKKEWDERRLYDSMIITERDLLNIAADLLFSSGELSVSLLQSSLNIGFNRAVEIIETLREKRIVIRCGSVGNIRYKPIVSPEEAKRRMGS